MLGLPVPRRRFAAALALLLALGCDPASVEDDLVMTADTSSAALVVDTMCDPACEGDDSASVDIAYASGSHLADDIVELQEYRVDFNLHGIDREVPYFAGEYGVKLQPGAERSISLPVVGSAQREFVRKAAPDRSVSGTATLQFAGYDYNNRHVFIDADFAVRFEDVSAPDAAQDAGVGDAP